MRDIHQQIFQESSHNFIGLPYEDYDCYDLVKKFYRDVLGLDLEQFSYNDPLDKKHMSILIGANKKTFKRVSAPKFGDVVVLNVYGMSCHLGVYLWQDKFMHTTVKTGAIIDTLKQWSKRIEGFYTYDKNKAQ